MGKYLVSLQSAQEKTLDGFLDECTHMTPDRWAEKEKEMKWITENIVSDVEDLRHQEMAASMNHFVRNFNDIPKIRKLGKPIRHRNVTGGLDEWWFQCSGCGKEMKDHHDNCSMCLEKATAGLPTHHNFVTCPGH